MKLHIQHRTTYSYTWPVLYSIQHVRLVPQQNQTQRIIDWKIKTPAKHQSANDHHGNMVHTFSVNQQHRELTVQSYGHVEIDPLCDGYVPSQAFSLNPLVYTPTTPLTQFNDEMRDFASFVADPHIPFVHRILTLAHAVADRVVYTKGSTTVADSAIDAFEKGQGVCQDHSHVMLACLRAHRIPARYVSGYFFNPNVEHHDSHAWIEVFDENRQQWLGVDATHKSLVQGNHCRLAVAKDFTGASPIRGIRTGGGQESMQVQVMIERVG
jgi:transglutaminase-like putative cysteine protease